MRIRKRPIQSKRTYKDSLPDENLQAGRAGAAEHDVDLFEVHEGVPLVPRELHELARHINSRSIDREEDFIIFDYHLCRLSHARSLVDLCLGELLSAFRKRDGKACGEMGYSRLDDFACEHLSFSGRLASELILNFERLQALPLTREAYMKGKIVKSALRLLLRVATRENEADLLAETRVLSVREVEELVKERSKTVKVCLGLKKMAGGDAKVDEMGKAGAAASINDEPAASDSFLSPEEQASEEIPSEEADRGEGSGVVMKFSVSRTIALTWDFALEHFRENDRTNGPLYSFVEALVSSFLDSTADLVASESRDSDIETTAEDGPAFIGGREVPLLYTDAIWDCFPSERENRARCRNGSLKPAETGGCQSAGTGGFGSAESDGGKPEDKGDDYPDPQNEERLRLLREILSLKPFVVKLPEEYSQIPTDSYALARKIIRVASMRQSLDYHIGWFLKAVHDRRLFRIMEFSKIEDYAKARISISASTTFRLIRLVSYFSNHPVIEKAFLRRRITREQAYLIASLEDGRHEKIWLDFAMSRPARELRDEVSRMLRIKDYDYFAAHNYALLPGFRYITDDRYDALSDEMKDILRTGAWYQGPGSQWPLESYDECFLDKDFADNVDPESCTAQLSKCAADQDEGSDLADAAGLSKCAANVETGACQCREGNHSVEAIEKVKALCTLPNKHRPAATLLLDVLESLAGQAAGGFRSHHREPAMSIRFFLPCGMYGVWNEAVRRYISFISPDDGVEMLVNNEGVENFIAILLTQYLLTEKAHHKAAHNSKVLERDGYKCQVPGCSNRRNIHAHHLEFRSHGGCDASSNLLCLCASHHLWILHILHGLKVEGTSPDSLTFTFGPGTSPEGHPFMIYRNGRKVQSPEQEEAGSPR